MFSLKNHFLMIRMNNVDYNQLFLADLFQEFIFGIRDLAALIHAANDDDNAPIFIEVEMLISCPDQIEMDTKYHYGSVSSLNMARIIQQILFMFSPGFIQIVQAVKALIATSVKRKSQNLRFMEPT